MIHAKLLSILVIILSALLAIHINATMNDEIRKKMDYAIYTVCGVMVVYIILILGVL